MYMNVLLVYYILLHHFGFRRYDLDNKYILNITENNEY